MTKLSFTDHPHSVGESYSEHMRTAFSFAGPLLYAGVACLIHGFLPFLCTTTGSSTVRKLHDRMVVHRVKTPAAVGVVASHQ